MADVEIIANEEYTHVFTCYDEDGVFDVSGFSGYTLDIRPTNFTGTLLLDSKSLSFTDDGTDGRLSWGVDPTDFSSQPAGPAYGMITLTDGTNTKKSFQFDVMILRDLA